MLVNSTQAPDSREKRYRNQSLLGVRYEEIVRSFVRKNLPLDWLGFVEEVFLRAKLDIFFHFREDGMPARVKNGVHIFRTILGDFPTQIHIRSYLVFA